MDQLHVSSAVNRSRNPCRSILTFVNNALKSYNRKQSARNGSGSNGTEDNQTEQAPGVAASLASEEELGAWYLKVAAGSHLGNGIERQEASMGSQASALNHRVCLRFRTTKQLRSWHRGRRSESRDGTI